MLLSPVQVPCSAACELGTVPAASRHPFWGAEGAPILFSEIGFCMASCSYIYIYVCMYIYICQDGGDVGFVEFTKLLFALSSLAQPLKRVRSIP